MNDPHKKRGEPFGSPFANGRELPTALYCETLRAVSSTKNDVCKVTSSVPRK